MARNMLPDLAFLNECFLYDPETGALTWRPRPREHFHTDTDRVWKRWNTQNAGKSVRCLHTYGYFIVSISTKRYFAHRIIWKMHNGIDCPAEFEIDHINRNTGDNRIANLRLATSCQNHANATLCKINSVGMKGVSSSRNLGDVSYRATISVNGRQKHLGTFSTVEDAHAAYCAAAQELHGEFWSDGT
jgi:HNH endonuclease/AP2 domain